MNKATTFEISRPPTIVQPPRTMFQRPDYLSYPLDVIITVFNSARYRTRWKHYEDFVSHCNLAGDAVRLWVVEVAFGDREFVITSPHNERHLQLRTTSELWHKERSQNLLVQRIVQRHPRARWFAFVDPDISFIRHDWADETRHALQHYDVVQMWEQAYDLDDKGNIIQEHRSFAYCHKNKLPMNSIDGDSYGGSRKGVFYPHPGYAWAWRREAFESVGGLIDWAILGSADFHMAYGLIGKMDLTLRRKLHYRYSNAMKIWQERAEESINRNIGYMHGSIFHHYHGAKRDRRYKDRWKILEHRNFNQENDLIIDAQGLYKLRVQKDDRSRGLRDDVRAYFHQRNEDK